MRYQRHVDRPKARRHAQPPETTIHAPLVERNHFVDSWDAASDFRALGRSAVENGGVRKVAAECRDERRGEDDVAEIARLDHQDASGAAFGKPAHSGVTCQAESGRASLISITGMSSRMS